MIITETYVPSGCVDSLEIEAGTRYFELLDTPVIETVPDLPRLNQSGVLMDSYNPSGEVNGKFAVRYEERSGMYEARSCICQVMGAGAIKLARDAAGDPISKVGEDPGLFQMPDGR